jgi:hypothetical protein
LKSKRYSPSMWPLWFLISKRPKGNLKRPEFFAGLRRHGQREGVVS